MGIMRNKTFIVIVVAILILGMALVYIPLLFVAPTPAQPGGIGAAEGGSSASLLGAQQLSTATASPETAPKVSGTAPSAGTTTSMKEHPALEGFSGLQDEQQSLEELNGLFGEAGQ